MNIEDLISQYIDGSLPSEAEAELHHRLAVSPEARRLFRAHIMLKGVARDQRVLQVPSAESRAKLFERLGREEGMKLPGSQSPSGYDPTASPDPGTNPATGTAPGSTTPTPTGPTPRSIASPAVRGNASRRRRRVLPWLIPVVMAGLMIGILWNVGDEGRRGSGNIAGTKVEDLPPGRTGDLSNPSAPQTGTFSDAGPLRPNESTPNGADSRTGNAAAGRASGPVNEMADTMAGGSGMASGKGGGAIGSASGSNLALQSAPSDDVSDHTAATSSPERLEYKVPPEQRSAPRIASSRQFRSRDGSGAERSASRDKEGLYERETSPRLNRTGAQHQADGLTLNGSGAAKAPSVDLDAQSRTELADASDAKQQAERRALGGKEDQSIKDELGSKLGGGYTMSVPPPPMWSQDSTSYRVDGRIAASESQESLESKSIEGDNVQAESKSAPRVEHLSQSNSFPTKDLALSIEEGGQSPKVAKKSVTAEKSVQAQSKQAEPPVLSSNAAQVTSNDGAPTSMPSDGIATAAPPPPPAPEVAPTADSSRVQQMRSTTRSGDEDNPLSPYASAPRVQYVAGLAQRSMVNLRASSFTVQLVARGGVELRGGHQLYLLVGGTSYRRIGFDTVIAAASAGIPVTPTGPLLASDTASRFDEVFGGVGYRYTALLVIHRVNIGLGGWTGAGKRYFRAGAEVPVTFELNRAIRIELIPTLEYARPFSSAATSTATEIDPSLPYSEQRHRTETPEGSGDLSVGIGIGASVRW